MLLPTCLDLNSNRSEHSRTPSCWYQILCCYRLLPIPRQMPSIHIAPWSQCHVVHIYTIASVIVHILAIHPWQHLNHSSFLIGCYHRIFSLAFHYSTFGHYSRKDSTITVLCNPSFLTDSTVSHINCKAMEAFVSIMCYWKHSWVSCATGSFNDAIFTGGSYAIPSHFSTANTL